MAGQPWTEAEVEILAETYFVVLDAELAGDKVNKHLALLRAEGDLPHRTYHTLMDRCYRISEELWKRDLPWVQGWKPPAMGNQRANTDNMATVIWAGIEARAEKYRSGGAGTPAEDEPNGGSQAYATEAELRKAIEDVAQNRLMQHFRQLGWVVEDTHLTSPFDARATKASAVQYLEAKGTTSNANSVFVTSGEVDWARDHPSECVMGIVSNIELDPEGFVDATSGTLRLVDWTPDSGELKPIQYQWSPPDG